MIGFLLLNPVLVIPVYDTQGYRTLSTVRFFKSSWCSVFTSKKFERIFFDSISDQSVFNDRGPQHTGKRGITITVKTGKES